MTTFSLSFTKAEAKKFIAEAQGVDTPEIKLCAASLADQIAEHEAENPLGPLRKVVKKSIGFYQMTERLECGHAVSLSFSVPSAKRRRCAHCLKGRGK